MTTTLPLIRIVDDDEELRNSQKDAPCVPWLER